MTMRKTIEKRLLLTLIVIVQMNIGFKSVQNRVVFKIVIKESEDYYG